MTKWTDIYEHLSEEQALMHCTEDLQTVVNVLTRHVQANEKNKKISIAHDKAYVLGMIQRVNDFLVGRYCKTSVDELERFYKKRDEM